jgi:hypothetical protein
MANPTEPAATPKAPAPAPKADKAEEPKKANTAVRIRTRIGEVLDLSGHGLGKVTSEGADYKQDDADKVLMLARKNHVVVSVDEMEK